MSPLFFYLRVQKIYFFYSWPNFNIFGPILTIFIKDKKYYDFIDLIEKENIEMLIDQIEKNNASLNK